MKVKQLTLLDNGGRAGKFPWRVYSIEYIVPRVLRFDSKNDEFDDIILSDDLVFIRWFNLFIIPQPDEKNF